MIKNILLGAVIGGVIAVTVSACSNSEVAPLS
jgi:hypothetical protein